MLEFKTTTYGCVCGYKVDATAFENVDYFTRFGADLGVAYGTCPSCKTGQLAKLLDLTEVSTHLVSEDADLEALKADATDENGSTIMVESDKTQQAVGIVDGQPTVVETPVMVPQKRDLTDQELAELKAQRDQNLDMLNPLVVQEVTPTPEETPPA